MTVHGERRESLFIAVDDELLRQLDELAKAGRVTRHELARVAMRLGVGILSRRASPEEQLPMLDGERS